MKKQSIITDDYLLEDFFSSPNKAVNDCSFSSWVEEDEDDK